jgi:methylated-DNA-[protein]-cysteine S-methyltransferase
VQSIDIQTSAVAAFKTPLGWIGAIVNETGVERIHFGHQTKREVLDKLSIDQIEPLGSLPDWWNNAQKLLVSYANGESVDLSTIPIADLNRTPFQQRVVKNLMNVGYGQTITYGELARRAGSSGAARAVGNQMAKNCVPLLLPCHRVVGSGGKLGGFSAPQGLSMKLRLLEMENVDCEKFQLTTS